MAKLTILREAITQDMSCGSYEQRLMLLEDAGVEKMTARELLHVGSGLSGASLAALWASLGTAATAASVKSLLVAIGVVNPVVLTTVGTVAALGLATATTVAGGKLAYTIAKDASRGVFNPPPSQRAMADLMDVIKKRDKLLLAKRKNRKPEKIAELTTKMQQVAQELHDLAYKDLKKKHIDKKTYDMYIRMSEKGVLGQLSTIV